MQIHADLSQRAVVDTTALDWVASPAAGVERKMLDRDGGEVARATSLVRFAPGSDFETHTHGAGEEFLVLDGVFSDETGDYGRGAYVRNPTGSSHAPSSAEGCTIFVKLRQFAPGDDRQFTIDTRAAEWQPQGMAGVGMLPLHAHGSEQVMLLRLDPGTRFPEHNHPGGEEIFVLEGALADEFGHYPEGTWVRSPPGSAHTPVSDEGCLIYLKIGHLPITGSG